MDFFAAQDRSRRITRRLVIAYILAMLVIVTLVTGIVAIVANSAGFSGSTAGLWAANNWPLLGGAAASTAGFIGLASAYKVARLSSGGSRVALDMGGSAVPADVADPLRRRLRNVVEEMAIASGVPVPQIYVLEEEQAINAFAAGFSTDDAAIAVTRGTLETLTRDELQGVVAHEFSHILNGDMRLNIRLMGLMFGILAIAMIGRLILRGSSRSRMFRSNSRKGGGAAVGLVLGLGLFVVGYIGVFIGRLIKASVSRQREFLADASAVQFTRQSDGIAGALKKIAGLGNGSAIQTDAEEISHMLFALGSLRFSGWFATHPPILERIKALDASFDPSQHQQSSSPIGSQFDPGDHHEMPLAPMVGSTVTSKLDSSNWLNDSGQPADEHIVFAGHLRRSVPELLLSAAHSRDQSLLLAVALVLDRDGIERERQFQFLETRLGELRSRRIRALYDEFTTLGPAYRLPLLDIAFPALKARPAKQIAFLVDLVDSLIHMDGQVDLYEYAFARVLQSQLGDATRTRQALMGKKTLKDRSQDQAARKLLAIFAHHGEEAEADATTALQSGLKRLPRQSDAKDEFLIDIPADWITACDAALASLNRLNAMNKKQLLLALIDVAACHNGLNTAEAEMLRAIAAVLQIPLTPLIPKD